MRIGLDVLLSDERNLLKGKRLGVLAHRASYNSEGKHIVDLLTAEEKEWKVNALFGPEHGLSSDAQDMIPVESTTHVPTGLPLYSLYGHSEKSLTPKKYMFDRIDALVIDLQDIGARYYTYVWTALLAIEVCGKLKKEVIICDRPNPINGTDVEGEVNQRGYTSFVGLYPIPVRHGMTLAEVCRLVNDTNDLGADLKIVQMERWNRKWYWEETGLSWRNPSPNMRSPNEALLYPGMCLLEATNFSEGRGTPTPFEVVGAPFVDSKKLIEHLAEFNLPGIVFEEAVFTPSIQKWSGKKCSGVRFKITDREIFKPYATGIALVWALYYLHKASGFQWRMEPYEFIEDIPAIDLLTGGTVVRNGIEKHLPLSEILEWVGEPADTFMRQRTPYLLY